MSETKKTTVAPKAPVAAADSEKEALAAQLKASQDMNANIIATTRNVNNCFI